MKIILVTHPARAHGVAQLIDSGLPIVASVIDTVSALSGHMAALRIAAQLDERVAIMEDDAVPVEQWDDLSDGWDEQYPEDVLSFYLGTARPLGMQPLVDRKLAEADAAGLQCLWLPTLIHGVCYSIPPRRVGMILERMPMMRIREADFAIGAAWGREVCYPLESLVQHRDEDPVERHPDGYPRTQPRVARRLAGPLMFNPTQE